MLNMVSPVIISPQFKPMAEEQSRLPGKGVFVGVEVWVGVSVGVIVGV